MAKSSTAGAGQLVKRPLLVSACLAAVAVLIAHVYLRRYETQLSGGDRVPLVFLTKDVAAGDVLSKSVLTTRLVPLAYVDERDVREHDIDRVVGVEASFDLPAQQKLQWSDLTVRPDSRQISQLVMPGRRAVIVHMRRMDPTTIKLVRPGDYADIVATIADTDGKYSSTVLLQRVLVVAVGDVTERSTDVSDPEHKRSQEAQSLTFSLDLEESQLMALAESRGELSIAVRNADDQRLIEDIPDIRASNLLEAQQALVARRQSRVRPTTSGPVRLTEAQ
jgi:pilus assembly protein CpaB